MARTDEERGVWHPANSITALPPEDDVAFYRRRLPLDFGAAPQLYLSIHPLGAM